MPIYEYVCTTCGHEQEALQKISAPPLTLCESCNNETLKKKISAAGFRLSGSGWYETDFKKNKQKNLLANKESNSDGNSKTDQKTDSKPETKATDSSSKTTQPATTSNNRVD